MAREKISGLNAHIEHCALIESFDPAMHGAQTVVTISLQWQYPFLEKIIMVHEDDMSKAAKGAQHSVSKGLRKRVVS